MKLTQSDVDKFNQIAELLAEAYEHYFEHTDGYSKSSEGYIALSLPPYYWREDEPVQLGVEIYSYVFGPSRQHLFDSLDEALETVREWHHEQLGTVYCADCGLPARTCFHNLD